MRFGSKEEYIAGLRQLEQFFIDNPNFEYDLTDPDSESNRRFNKILLDAGAEELGPYLLGAQASSASGEQTYTEY
jgi:hypothetical protein